MRTRKLTDVDASMTDLVGGKATGLGEMIAAGERVPPGFCLTTEAHDSGGIARAELLAAYHELGAGPVAVRSSATAEDLPDASFAGQQDTILNVEGDDSLVDAVRRCRESLNTDRAVAYRESNTIDHDTVRMAVVVQRMVSPSVAGVAFTANPITGNRDEMTVDAAFGLGTAVVDGTVVPDHYVLDAAPSEPAHGCLTASQLSELYEAGRRLRDHFGSPQDIEWAFDTEGTLWLLQSRAITTLFPLPPDRGLEQPRVFVHFGPTQGLHGPMSPMGMSMMQSAAAEMINYYGGSADPVQGPTAFAEIAGRMYADVTAMIRNKRGRKKLPEQLRMILGPRVAEALERVREDPRFSPRPGLPFRMGPVLKLMVRYSVPATIAIIRGLVRPAAARERAWRATRQLKEALNAPVQATTATELLDACTGNWGLVMGRSIFQLSYPLFAGMIATQAPISLLKGIAEDGELDTVLRGMPHNVTTEMDLDLWRLASSAVEHRELLCDTPPTELAGAYRAGSLPDIGLDTFLENYGHRSASELDVAIPRWREDPTPVFAAIANYLRIRDPEQAPDRRFARAAAEAETKLDELAARARRKRPVRGHLAGFMMRRGRELGGLRELTKFAWIPVIGRMRHHLLLAGTRLAERGLLERGDDIMFLTLAEAREAANGADLRSIAAERHATYLRETRRHNAPDVLLSDGTDAVSLIPTTPAPDGALVGMAGAAGTVTAAARIVRDPTTARIEPGEILVAPSTDPGWTPLFMTAGGLVTETGGPNAHGPTVAREYGIPAVIGVPDATARIASGQLVTVDGTSGTVTLVQPEATPADKLSGC